MAGRRFSAKEVIEQGKIFLPLSDIEDQEELAELTNVDWSHEDPNPPVEAFPESDADEECEYWAQERLDAAIQEAIARADSEERPYSTGDERSAGEESNLSSVEPASEEEDAYPSSISASDDGDLVLDPTWEPPPPPPPAPSPHPTATLPLEAPWRPPPLLSSGAPGPCSGQL